MESQRVRHNWAPFTSLHFSALWGNFSHSSQLVKNLLQCRWPWFNSWVKMILWRRDRLPTPVFLGFPCGSAGKGSTRNAGDLGLIPGLGRSPGEGKGYPLQYSGLENSMDYTVDGVAKSQTQLSTFHFISLHFRVRRLGLTSWIPTHWLPIWWIWHHHSPSAVAPKTKRCYVGIITSQVLFSALNILHTTTLQGQNREWETFWKSYSQ